MAKKQSAEEAETNKSIGSQMKSKLTQKERNLAVKAEMIAKGLRPAPKGNPGESAHEKNLRLKNEKEKEDDTGKGKGKGKSN